MKLRLEIDLDEESLIEDGTLSSHNTSFELRSEIAEIRKEILATLVESGRWTVERGQAGIYFLIRDSKANKEVAMGFKKEVD